LRVCGAWNVKGGASPFTFPPLTDLTKPTETLAQCRDTSGLRNDHVEGSGNRCIDGARWGTFVAPTWLTVFDEIADVQVCVNTSGVDDCVDFVIFRVDLSRTDRASPAFRVVKVHLPGLDAGDQESRMTVPATVPPWSEHQVLR